MDDDHISIKTYVDTRFDAWDKSIESRLQSMDRAVQKAETAIDRRLESVNEFRQTLSDQAGNFLTRIEFNGELKSVLQRIDVIDRELRSRFDISKGKSQGWGTAGGLFYAVIIAASAIIGIFLSVFLRNH